MKIKKAIRDEFLWSGFAFDAVTAVGLACEAYLILFITYATKGGEALWRSPTPPFIGLLTCLIIIALGLLFSWRSVSIIGWAGASLIASDMYDIQNFGVENISRIYTVTLGLALPLLIVLEVILTRVSATARARVVFRPRALLKAVLLTTTLFAGMLLAFSYVPILGEYSTSPEAATFQAAMIAGLATIVMAVFLLARPKGGQG